MDAAIAEGQALGFPIATTIQATLTYDILGTGITVGEVYLFVILASVFVCTLAIQGAATRMMFSMSRDRHLPGGTVGSGQRTFKTPANAAIAVGVLAAIPIFVIGPLGGFSVSIAATGPDLLQLPLDEHRRAGCPLPRLAAQAGVVQPRPLGQAGQHPGDPVWRPDADQHRHLAGPGLSGTSVATAGGHEPDIDGFIKPFGNAIDGHAGLADLRDPRRAPDRRRDLLPRRGPWPRPRRRVADLVTGEADIG